MKKSEKSMAGWYFLLIVIAAYFVVFVAKSDTIAPSLSFFISIITKILPIFVLIFALLVAIDYWVRPESIVKHLGKGAGAKGWAWAIISGIISTGPIYMWYPLLNEMQKKGARDAYIAAFLYNRALKPALLPLFIYYFGLAYVVVLSIVMVIMSIAQGIAVEKILEVKK